MGLPSSDHDLLVRVAERVDASVASLEKHMEHDRQEFRLLHQRVSAEADERRADVRKLENRQTWIIGTGAGIAFVFGVAASWIKNVFTGSP